MWLWVGVFEDFRCLTEVLRVEESELHNSAPYLASCLSQWPHPLSFALCVASLQAVFAFPFVLPSIPWTHWWPCPNPEGLSVLQLHVTEGSCQVPSVPSLKAHSMRSFWLLSLGKLLAMYSLLRLFAYAVGTTQRAALQLQTWETLRKPHLVTSDPSCKNNLTGLKWPKCEHAACI